MSRRWLYSLLAVSVCAFAIYTLLRWPPGIETKGTEQTVVLAYLSLATAIVSLLTALTGLLKIVMERKRGGSA